MASSMLHFPKCCWKISIHFLKQEVHKALSACTFQHKNLCFLFLIFTAVHSRNNDLSFQKLQQHAVCGYKYINALTRITHTYQQQLVLCTVYDRKQHTTHSTVTITDIAITHLCIHSAHRHKQLKFSYLYKGNNGLWTVKFFHSVHSCILISSSILQPNARYIFATYIFYQISPTCFGLLYTILKENFLCLLKTISFL